VETIPAGGCGNTLANVLSWWCLLLLVVIHAVNILTPATLNVRCNGSYAWTMSWFYLLRVGRPHGVTLHTLCEAVLMHSTWEWDRSQWTKVSRAVNCM